VSSHDDNPTQETSIDPNLPGTIQVSTDQEYAATEDGVTDALPVWQFGDEFLPPVTQEKEGFPWLLIGAAGLVVWMLFKK
jgi:hypothetical protein